MCTGNSGTGYSGSDYSGSGFASAADALAAAEAALDFLNSPDADLPGSACGEVLVTLGRIQAKHAAARAEFLRRFDAADAHDADGYGSSSAWLAAAAQLTPKDAKAAVKEMHRHRDRPLLAGALRAGAVTQSWADEIAAWTRRLPVALRQETDRIILEAAAAGSPLDDLKVIARYAVEAWRKSRPDPDDPDPRDRAVQVATTFGGAAVVHGSLTPECAAALLAVLDSLGKRQGAEDSRTEAQRHHDALQEACTLLLRSRLLPQRAGADTQAIVHIPLSQLRTMPGAPALEDAWIRARLGEDGYLTGDDAQVAACDAMIVPVVTGAVDLTVIDKMIALARAAAPGGSPEAQRAHRYAIARLAVDLVSGPSGIAATLRTGLLDRPYRTRSVPLDIGWSDSIPAQIRRAVLLRDRGCAWPRCGRPAVACDVHHLRHKGDGGETSVSNCVLVCNFHHDVCIHRRGWQLTLHPDGSTEARSPDGTRILHSNAPPGDAPDPPSGARAA